MCNNPEKARYMKILVAEIRAEIAQRRARKAAAATVPTKAWPGQPAQPAQPALAGFRRPA